jgi:teichuronic acid biosynthesis glycosyltransferase TuaG
VIPAPPTVSIITPAHNAVRFLDETIRSVTAQTFQDWEMIVVDDGSTDGTRALLERWIASEPRIRLLLQTPRQGAAAARNRALTEARGRYVAFLDSDDLWMPRKLEAQVAFMRETGTAFSFTTYSVIDELGRRAGPRVVAPDRVDYQLLLRNTIIGCLTVMLDQSQLPALRMPLLRQHEDLSLWYAILKTGVIARGIPEDLALYRVARGSASGDKVRSALHMWKVYRDQERLPVGSAIWCFAQYACNALRKTPGRLPS